MAFIVANIILVIATLLPMSRSQAWWVRGLDFPRLQLFVIAAVLLLLEILLLALDNWLAWLLIFCTFASIAYHAWWIIPYTPFFPKEVKKYTDGSSSAELTIMTANVLTPNRNAPGLVNLVQQYNPDILVTLETDNWWQQQLDVLEAEYPYSMKSPLDNLYGMHVYSRLQLEKETIEFLVESDVPSMHARVCLPSGDKISVHFLHPAPPSPTENEKSRERDTELLVVAKSVKEETGPIIVTGDLNDVAWSETTRLFRKLSGLLDPRIGRGMFNTYNAKQPLFRWPLDHIFHSAHFQLKNIKRLPGFGSDHFPLLTELMYIGERLSERAGLTADKNDKELAKEKIDNEAVKLSDVPQPGNTA